MKEASIEEKFRRANRRLMTSLDDHQRRQAIEEFRAVLQQEMSRVQEKLERGQKVQQNLQELQREAESQKQELQTSLNHRMQMHFKKRELLHLQKLKIYRKGDGQWRDRLNTIASQAKERQKNNALLSNRLGQQALKFWQKKEEQNRDTPSKKQPRYFSQDHTADLVAGGETHFLTEVNVDSSRRGGFNDAQELNFPSIRRGSALRTEGAGSKSVALDRPRSEIIREHLMKSSELWEERQGANFQRAMQKLDHIEQTRSKVRQKLVHESQRIRRSRMLKEGSQNQRFFNIKKEEVRRSPRGSSVSPPHPATHASPRLATEQPSQVHKRRSQLLDTEFRDRSRHFEVELRKQQKGGFRKMVREAVQSVKLQALRGAT